MPDAAAVEAPQETPAAAPNEDRNNQAAAHFGARRREAAIAALDALGSRQPARSAATAPATEPAPAVTAAPAEPAKPAAAPAPAQPEPAEVDEFAPQRKQEIHLRRQHAEALARKDEEHAKSVEPLKSRAARADELEAMLADARTDPMALLKAAGFGEAEFTDLARVIYAHSPDGAKDPKARAAAGQGLAQTKAQREHAEKLEKMQARLDAFEREAQAREAQAREQAQVEAYFRSITGSIDDTAPHTKHLIGKDPQRAQAKLLEVADRLYVESGPSPDLRDVPSAKQVLKAYETQRLAEIKEGLAELVAMGIDPATLIERPAATAKPAAATVAAPSAAPAAAAATAAPARPSPTTLTPGGGTPTQLQRPGRKSRADLVADIERMTARR